MILNSYMRIMWPYIEKSKLSSDLWPQVHYQEPQEIIVSDHVRYVPNFVSYDSSWNLNHIEITYMQRLIKHIKILVPKPEKHSSDMRPQMLCQPQETLYMGMLYIHVPNSVLCDSSWNFYHIEIMTAMILVSNMNIIKNLSPRYEESKLLSDLRHPMNYQPQQTLYLGMVYVPNSVLCDFSFKT